MDYLRQKLEKENIRSVIFDFDETISTLHINWTPWFRDMEKLFLSYDGSFTYSSFPELLEKQTTYIKKYGKDIVDKIIEINYRNEKEYYSGQTPNTKIVEFIKNNFKKYDLYVWTSNDTRTIRSAMKELGIEGMFKKVITRNDVFYIKPNPEGFAKMEIKDAGDTLMIGDSFADEKASKAAGIQFINVKELI